MPFEMLDVVALTVDLPEHGLVRGAQGTIVEMFERPRTAYEVEFCDDDGRTTAMMPLLPEQITLSWRADPTAHAAE